MDNELKIKQLERDLVDAQVSRYLLDLVQDVIICTSKGCIPDVSPHARKIVAYCREHIVE